METGSILCWHRMRSHSMMDQSYLQDRNWSWYCDCKLLRLKIQPLLSLLSTWLLSTQSLENDSMESGWTVCPPYQQIPSDSRYLGQRPLLSVPGEALTQLTWLVLLFTIILRTEVALRCQKDRHISNQPGYKTWRYFETMVTENNVSTAVHPKMSFGQVGWVKSEHMSKVWFQSASTGIRHGHSLLAVFKKPTD